MAVPLLEAIADAIYAYEGNTPNQRAYRNRNPGNLRSAAGASGVDAGGYCEFHGLLSGYAALLLDLQAKVTGHNQHGLHLHSTLLDLFEVYAPTADHNWPRLYAMFVARRLAKTYGRPVSVGATFFDLYTKIALQPVPDAVSLA